MRRGPFMIAVAACWLATAVAFAADPAGFTTLNIGDAAPDFKLPGVDGKDYTLADFSKAKLLLVLFTCNHCPTAQAYDDRVNQLQADYKDNGVALVAISPNDPLAVRLDELGYTEFSDSLDEMKQRAKDRGFEFPYLYDGETQKTSLDYGVLATPQVYLFDAGRKLRYVGRIDDSDVKTVTSHDARNAIDALLAGQPVPVERTRTFGCSTKWSDKRADATASLKKWDQEPVELKPLDEVGLERLVKNDTEKLLVVNVWATWCGPCVAEMPEFVTMHRMYRKRNFQLVTLSIDDLEQKDAALKVLRENHASATNYIASIANRDRLADILDKDWQGPIPYTIVIAPGGKVIYRKNGEIDSIEVRKQVVDTIGRTYANRARRVGCAHHPYLAKDQHMLRIALIAACLWGIAGWNAAAAQQPLTIAWDKNYLTIRGEFPGSEIRIHYLEAYCRPGSTDQDWRTQTVIPHTAEQLEASADGKLIKLRNKLADGVVVEHTLTASTDEVDFRLTAHNPTDKPSLAHWAQPCIRVDKFTGAGNADARELVPAYARKCFLFIDGKLTRLPTEPWADKARYVPGQVYVPKNVDRNDVNPRPLSSLVPTSGLCGCFSADEKLVMAVAWEPYQEIFQGVIACLHSDFRVGGLAPGQTKHIRGKLYVVPADVPQLVKRYERDFPEQVTK